MSRLIEGGQGRSAKSIEDAAYLWAATMVVAALLLFAAWSMA